MKLLAIRRRPSVRRETQTMSEVPDLQVDRYVSDGAASEILGLSRSYLRQCRVSGRGPTFSKFGARAIRYRVGDLLDWAARKSLTSTSGAPGH